MAQIWQEWGDLQMQVWTSNQMYHNRDVIVGEALSVDVLG